jgi:hypothetical protein
VPCASLEANGSFCRALLSAHDGDAAGPSGHANTEADMYNRGGHDIFVIDGHTISRTPARNWRNKYGRAGSNAHAFHSGLSPAEVWPFTNFADGEEVLVNDLFRTGYVDMAILNSTYLYEFYKNGFNSRRNNVIRPSIGPLVRLFRPSGRGGRYRRVPPDDGGYPIGGSSSTRPNGAARAAGASTMLIMPRASQGWASRTSVHEADRIPVERRRIRCPRRRLRRHSFPTSI